MRGEGCSLPFFFMITQQFTRQFVNDPSFRTPANKAVIREEYQRTFGGRLNAGCSTCYIEALFKILNKKQMASSNYILKKGVVLTVFSDARRTYTWKTITDEIAAQILAEFPEKRIFFDQIPVPVVEIPEPVVDTPEPVAEEKYTGRPVDEITHELVAQVTKKRTPKKHK